MKKIWYVIIAVVIVIIVFFLIFTHKPKKMNSFRFPETIIVNNYTSIDDADTIIKVLINRIFGYDTARINIYYMPLSFDKNDTQIFGFITKNEFESNSYNLFIAKNDSYNLFTLLSHEFIHFDQMQKGLLVQPAVGYKYNIWMNDTVKLFEVPYEERKYEIDAYNRCPEVERKLRKLLYLK
jgi:hypothetical protein